MKKYKVIKISIGAALLIAVIMSVSLFSASANQSTIMGVPVTNLPSDKQQALKKQQQLVSEAQEQPPASKYVPSSDYVSVVITPDEIGPTGILANLPEPFSSEDYFAINAWVGKVNNITTQVFAGYCTQNPKQGIIIVCQPDTGSTAYYKTPSLDGGLKITKADGNVLTMTAALGMTPMTGSVSSTSTAEAAANEAASSGTGVPYTFDMSAKSLTRK